jgi:hypothetical protein
MKATTDLGYDRPEPNQAGRAVWIALIVVSGPCLSPIFACATPFAALAALAALKLGWRDRIVVLGLVWLANQAIGFGLLGYPRRWDSAAWGLAIGASTALAVLAARGLSTTRPAPLAVSLPFIAAFAVFELGLYIAGTMLPGSERAFTAAVVGHVLLINAAALCALIAVYQLAMLLGLVARDDTSARHPIGAASFQ